MSSDTSFRGIMSFADWILLCLACLGGAASPGPSLALLIRSVIIDGQAAGVIFSIAHGAGILMYASLVITGLQTILFNSPQTLLILQVAGCGFLSWVAFKMIAGNQMDTPQRDKSQPPSSTSQPILKHAFEGFLIVFFLTQRFLYFSSQFLVNSLLRIKI